MTHKMISKYSHEDIDEAWVNTEEEEKKMIIRRQVFKISGMLL